MIKKNNSHTDIYPFLSDIDWLKKLNQLIIKDIKNPHVSNSLLAKKMNVSESHFYKLMKIKTGMSPNLYIRTVKLNFAKHLIETNEYIRVSDVAYQTGFRRIDYFSRLFSEKFGMRPKNMIAKNKKLPRRHILAA